MSDSKDKNSLSDSSEAVISYIESLLCEVPDEPVSENAEAQKSRVAPVIEPAALAMPITDQPVIEKPVADKPISDTVLLNHLDVAIDIASQTSEIKKPETTVQKSEGGPPDWAQHSFQSLLFKVSGLTLAVPLIKLCSVRAWHETDLTRTPSKIPWYLGLIEHQGQSVRIIDTAQMVLPENRRLDVEANPSCRFSHILLVDENRWGLACDSIGEVIQLVGDEVKWRGRSGKRPWLAGTAIERLCAIIDTDVFADMLNEKCA